MLEFELQQYLQREYPQENARCEWKEFKNLKNSFCGNEKDDVISYVSAIANMEGGHLVIGVRIRRLKLSEQIFHGLLSMDNLLTYSQRPSNLQNNALIFHLKD